MLATLNHGYRAVDPLKTSARPSRYRPHRGRASIVLIAFILALVGGCGSGLPKTHPVKGKVVFKGGKPVPDGRIEFQSLADPQIQAIGDIEPDGTFTLTTHKGGKSARGAVEGQHKVIVELERPVEVIVVPNGCTIERGENDLTIELPKARR